MEDSPGFNVGHHERSRWNFKECRACLYKSQKTNDCFNLFEAWPASYHRIGQTLASDLAQLCFVQIETGDGLSEFICQLCVEHLNRALSFISNVQSNDKILRNRLHNAENSNWPKPIQIDKNLTEFAPDHLQIKEEVLSDNEAYNTQEYENMSYGEIKIEPEEIVMPTLNNVEVNGLQENCQEQLTNGVADDNTLTMIKQEPKSDDEDLLTIDLPLDCLLCTKSFKCVTGLKAHVISMHSYKGVKRKFSTSTSPVKKVASHVCKMCRRTFTTPTDLMVHETCHNKSVCYSCNKSFDSFQKLTKHRTRCKAAKAELIKPKTLEDVIRHQEEARTASEENFKCDQCNEQFTDIFYLQVHQEIHNTDAIEYNVKFDSDTEAGKNKVDCVKDDLEKMLQADVTADSAKDSLQKLLQSDDSTQVTTDKDKDCYQVLSKETDRKIEADIVKESLQKLLQSDDSMDSLNQIVTHPTLEAKKYVSESKLDNNICDIQENKKTQNDTEVAMQIEIDQVGNSLQELFQPDSCTSSLGNSIQLENDNKTNMNLCPLENTDVPFECKIKLENALEENPS